MSSSRKRPSSPHFNEQRRKTARQEIIIISDDEEDVSMEIIALASGGRLQTEWNTAVDTSVASSLPVAGPSGLQDRDVITIDSDTEEESDGALARQPAREREGTLSDGVDSVVIVPSPSTPQIDSTRAFLDGRASCRSSTNVEISPDEDLSQCRDIFIAERDCSKCGHQVQSPRGHVMFTNNGPPPSLVKLLHAPCHRCNINHCRGCMSFNLCPVSCCGPSKNPKCKVEECCAEIRAIALYEALSSFDRQFLGEKASSAERARVVTKNAKNKHFATVGPGGTGYSTGSDYPPEDEYPSEGDYFPEGDEDPLYDQSFGSWHGGGGAGGQGWSRRVHEQNGPVSSQSENIVAQLEQIVIRAFETFTKYLPDPYSDKAQMYDMIPHKSIQSLLALSQLPELLGGLLRNDSVTDWIARSDTYHAMLGLLRRMADCELTLKVLISDGWEKASSCGLKDWMWQDGEINWELNDKGRIARTSPLYTHFKKLSRQCEAFIAGACQLVNADDDVEVGEMAVKGSSLCGDIIAARDDMERLFFTLGQMNSKSFDEEKTTSRNSKGKGKDQSLEMDRSYARECERLAFHHITMSKPKLDGGLIYKEFNYSDTVNATANQTRLPKDRLHLVKELAVLATCLPPGVWARVDDVRNDIIKFMIAGPEGTPYAGGLFEFDCFLPILYPNTPPLMHLRTTGGGRVRFNPNLYCNGKVCLSLLGTWPGPPEEKWQPRKSTLLQVLVSIQSMILIEMPYFNEPGYGKANPNNPKSIRYNREIRLQTVRHAIIEWMEDKYKSHIWRDVIASHFSIRNDKIRICIYEWSKEDSQFKNYTSQATITPNMKITPNDAKTWALEHDQKANMDLLAEYDRGIQRIKNWSQSAQDA